MAKSWRTVRVFISSTFRDMHSERDWLVKRVFPTLRERLEPHRIHLVDLDLRWGVTREQAENNQVLEFCLQQIDECRPFFLGILGERYGWVSSTKEIARQERWKWLTQHDGKSITELEILYGVLNHPKMQRRALFLFRDPAFMASIPAQLRRELESEDAESARKLARLKDAIRAAPLALPPVEDYPCEYSGLGINWRLARRELSPADRRGLDSVAHDGHVTPAEYTALDRPTRALVERFGTLRLGGLERFGQTVLESLWKEMCDELELASSAPVTVPNPTDSEQELQDRFVENRTRVYVGRAALQDALTQYAMARTGPPCLVTGPSGSGKSSALAAFVSHFRRENPAVALIAHFVGASPSSTSLRPLLFRLITLLKTHFPVEDEIPADSKPLASLLGKILESVPVDRPVVLVIDALNQLDESENAHSLYWLPTQLPPQVRLIVSCIEDADNNSLLGEILKQKGFQPMRLPPLTDAERLEILRRVPSLSAKSLDDAQIRLLLDNTATTNPLYLLAALEELRGFGSYEQLNARIASFPTTGDSVTDLFQQILERLEEEFDSSVVQDVLVLLASARRGLSDQELVQLVESVSKVSDSQGDLFPVLRQLRPYLQYRGPLRDFFHQNLQKAVQIRYLETDQQRVDAHSRLARFFERQDYFLESLEEQRARAKRFPPTCRPVNTRKVEELPWQLLQTAKLIASDDPKSALWDELADLFTNLDFLEARTEAVE